MDLEALDAIIKAVESGAGLPSVVRAAARALDGSLGVIDRAGHTLAVAARSPADERSLFSASDDVQQIELRVADVPVGRLLLRVRADPGAAMLRLVATLLASEVERVRAPQRASEEAVADFLHALVARSFADRAELLARASALGVELSQGASMLVVQLRPQAPTQEGWRTRACAVVERSAPGSLAALSEREGAAGAEVLLLIPGGEEPAAARIAAAVLHELEAGLAGYALALGRSRVAEDPLDLARAADEALLAANVAGGDPEHPMLAFEQTGAYRLLLSAMSENPAELQRFYAETLEPLVAYDEQYETDLVATVATFLEADGNVAGTAQRLFTHRHTVRYRLERVRELSGLDVGSSDGREKLSLGLKAMRVLGITAAGGPATESGTAAGRVPRKAR